MSWRALGWTSNFDLKFDSIGAIIRRMQPRVVVDTNVFISALLSASGFNRQVLRACLCGQALPLMGAALFHEYEELLGRKPLMERCPLTPKERRLFFASFLSVAEWVKVYYLWRPTLPDEGDNHLIELAVAGSAVAIVTNNISDLTAGELRFPKLRILTPRQFLSNIP